MTRQNHDFSSLFLADWLDAVFIHFRVDAACLQASIPFELDLWRRREAIVSLVAFTQRRLRPARGGRFLEILSAPLRSHEFLNLRTYIRRGDERGIFFLAEWIPNRLAMLIGPRVYGLPYRLARLRYRADCGCGKVRGQVLARGRCVDFRGSFDPRAPLQPVDRTAFDAFVVERYVAFTSCAAEGRCFRVSHAPWPIRALQVDQLETTLIEEFSWHVSAELIGAHFSRGVLDVGIGPPQAQNRSFTPEIRPGGARAAGLAKPARARPHHPVAEDCEDCPAGGPVGRAARW